MKKVSWEKKFWKKYGENWISEKRGKYCYIVVDECYFCGTKQSKREIFPVVLVLVVVRASNVK